MGRCARLGSPFEAAKGHPLGRAEGRAKGTPNKVNQSIREAIQMVFEQVGGVEHLVRLAQADPKTFVPLLPNKPLPQ